jgi:hypothetical protein
MKTKLQVAVLFAVLLILFEAGMGYSCTAIVQSHRQQFRNATDVFIGQVLSAVVNKDAGKNLPTEFPVELKVLVEKRWKGQQTNEMTLLNDGTAACGGVAFQKGDRYLIYAHRYADALVVHSFNTGSQVMSGENENRSRQIRELNSAWFRLKCFLWRL